MKLRDALIAGGLGAASGYFGAKASQAETRRKQNETERQNQLILLKEQNKQRAQTAREKMLQEMKSKADLEKETRKYAREDKLREEKNSREDKNAVRDHEWDVELQKIKSSNRTDKNAYTAKDRDKASASIDKGYAEYKNDPFTDPEGIMSREEWAAENMPTNYRIESGGESSKSTGIDGFDFNGIRSRIKKGANETAQPEPGGADMMARGSADLSGKSLKNGEKPVINKDKTTEVLDQKIQSDPAAIDIGQVLGLFTKGLVSVGKLSVKSLKAIKQAIQEHNSDLSDEQLAEFQSLDSQIDAQLSRIGESFKSTPYKDRVANVNASKLR